MKELSLSEFSGDWRGVVSFVEHGGEPIALYWEGRPVGLLLPPVEAARAIATYSSPAARHAAAEAGDKRHADSSLPTYLELLRDDPSLVPVLDGRRLEFMTMTNTSFVDPQQLYQFRDPGSGQIVMYRADELRQAIGRPFARVEFIPQNPRAFVEGQR